jgi:hypothetical protein
MSDSTVKKTDSGSQSASEPRASHTPGPWSFRDAHEDAASLFGVERCWEVGVDHPASCGLALVPGLEANARLIAAAPDLLAACEAVFKAHDTFLAELSESLEEQLSAAIKKARDE